METSRGAGHARCRRSAAHNPWCVHIASSYNPHTYSESANFCYLQLHAVYALYNKSKRIVLCLLTLVLAEVACSATNSIINIPRLVFSPACSTVLELRPVIQFGCVLSVL